MWISVRGEVGEIIVEETGVISASMGRELLGG